MRWISINTKTPEPAQYCFVKRGDSRSLAVWDNEFIYIYGQLSEEGLWAPAFLKGNYVDIPGTRGELDFIPIGVCDEDGNDWKGSPVNE